MMVALACLGALALMGLVFLSGPPPRIVGHVEEFTDGLVLFKLGFVGASLIAPTFAATLLLLQRVAGVPPHSARRAVAQLLLAGYLTLATVAYTTQYTFLPGLVERDPQSAGMWYLHDATSLTYALDLTGYALLALAALVIASTLVGSGGRLRAIAGCLVAMAALSLAALGLHAGGVAGAASVATIGSALFTLPILLLSIALGREIRRRSRRDEAAA